MSSLPKPWPWRKLKVRRIEVNGDLSPGVYAKDVVLHIIRTLGVKGGVGYAYEFAGSAIDAMSMEERMTLCNMSIEGGARCGYVNPDAITYDYLRGRDFAPKGQRLGTGGGLVGQPPQRCRCRLRRRGGAQRR
jgi:3-isopropylmalate/(R)-2-methylmalate dehydratase large subunit